MKTTDPPTTPLIPERVADAVEHGRRVAERKYPDREHLRTSHALLVAALRLSPRTVRDVELACGLGERVLEDQISRADRHLGLPVIGPMLADPRVLGPAAHAWLVRAWTAMLDRHGVLGGVDPDVDSVAVEVLRLGDAFGFAAARTHDAVDVDSPGGRAVTEGEARGIMGAAAVVEHSARAVADVAGRHAGVRS